MVVCRHTSGALQIVPGRVFTWSAIGCIRRTNNRQIVILKGTSYNENQLDNVPFSVVCHTNTEDKTEAFGTFKLSPFPF